MQSFTNLGYTVGGTVSPGCGLERFGYPNNPNQNTAFQSPYPNNDSARTAGIQHQQNQPINQNKTSWSGGGSPSGSGWNGWQYNNPGAGIINNQNQNQIQMQIQTPQTVGTPNMSRNVINGSQMSGPRDWRNLTGQNMNFNYQPVTTTGASSFLIPESYQPSPSPNQQNLKQNQNRSQVQVQALSPQQQMQIQAAHNAAVSVPYFDGGNNNNINTGIGLSNNHCQGDVCPMPMIPNPDPNANIIAQNSFREVKPLNCHVKIGSPDETPVIYSNTCYENNQQNQDQGEKGNGNGGRHAALEQPQQKFQRPGPGQGQYQGQQQIFQGQQQQQPIQQQAQMQYENKMAFPVQMPVPQYQGSTMGNQPYSINPMSISQIPLNNPASLAPTPVQIQNARKSHTPCGQCTACKYCSGDGLTNRTRTPGLAIPGGPALLVRGPRSNIPGAGGRTPGPDQKTTEISPSPLINIESNPGATKAAGILSSASVPVTVTNSAAAVRAQPLKFGQHIRK